MTTLKLQLYSIATLAALFGLVFAVLAGFMLAMGVFSLYAAIIITLIFNVVMLFLNPVIMDFTNKWLFKCKFYSYDELKKQNYKFVEFLSALSKKHKIAFPKIGIIADGSITAFTYGSRQNNARIILTQGIIDTLNEDELNAVIAHEFGHIKHRDFLVMTIASTLLQILYLIYVNARYARFDSDNQKGNAFIIMMGIIAFVFYIIGSYIVLFLSRVREYYADRFSADNTNGEILASALIKIGYGFLATKQSSKSMKLLESTRNLNLMDFKFANEFSTKNIENSIKYDIFSPWAALLELNSTHPLIGKRVKALKPMKLTIDNETKTKIWSGFWSDFFIGYSNFFLFIVILAALAILQSKTIVISGIILSIIFAYMIMDYRYPSSKAVKTNVGDIVNDIFASPIKGKPVLLEGMAIGEGVPGFSFSEDFVLKDKTGFVYINYEHIIPFMNLFVGYTQTRKLINHECKVIGWSFRDRMVRIDASEINNGALTSHNKMIQFCSVIKYLIVYGIIYVFI